MIEGQIIIMSQPIPRCSIHFYIMILSIFFFGSVYLRLSHILRSLSILCKINWEDTSIFDHAASLISHHCAYSTLDGSHPRGEPLKLATIGEVIAINGKAIAAQSN